MKAKLTDAMVRALRAVHCLTEVPQTVPPGPFRPCRARESDSANHPHGRMVACLWNTSGGTLKALERRGLVQVGVSPGWSYVARLTDAGRAVVKPCGMAGCSLAACDAAPGGGA